MFFAIAARFLLDLSVENGELSFGSLRSEFVMPRANVKWLMTMAAFTVPRKHGTHKKVLLVTGRTSVVRLCLRFVVRRNILILFYSCLPQLLT